MFLREEKMCTEKCFLKCLVGVSYWIVFTGIDFSNTASSGATHVYDDHSLPIGYKPERVFYVYGWSAIRNSLKEIVKVIQMVDIYIAIKCKSKQIL